MTPQVLRKLKAMQARYDELTRLVSDAKAQANASTYRANLKAIAELQAVLDRYADYQRVSTDLSTNRELAASADPDLRAMAEEEIPALERREAALMDEIRLLLVPKDPNDDRSVVLEIRAGTGGDEAALFAGDLYRMYSRYAERKGWVVDVMSLSDTGGGLKEVFASIEGKAVYERMKHESGVHRVQRVPVTEASGRIHTSTATVAVLPEAEEVEVQIDQKDLRVDTFCSSGPGGQSVNTTYSAVRITHLPTGLVVSQQDEKSQIKNRAKAMKVLRARLYELEQQKQHDQIAAERRGQIKTGDRSEKIRTYNFPQNRITDHRIGLTLHQLGDVMDGKLAPLVDGLVTHFEAARLKQKLVEA